MLRLIVFAVCCRTRLLDAVHCFATVCLQPCQETDTVKSTGILSTHKIAVGDTIKLLITRVARSVIYYRDCRMGEAQSYCLQAHTTIRG
jgi:hypothetical protein